MHKSEKFWDRTAKNYDGRSGKVSPGHLKTIEKIKKHLHEDDVVLDYGCATGTISNDIAKSVAKVYGVDISSKMIDRARIKAREQKNENTVFKHTTIFDESLAKESFNVILSFNILHLVDNTQMVLRRINELLKPGGVFISSTPCLGEQKSLFSSILSFVSKTGIIPKVNFLSTTDLKALILESGFEIIESEKANNTANEYFIITRKPEAEI